MPETSGFPLSSSALTDICRKTCEGALAGATEYEHKAAAQWNQTIINKLIEALVHATTPEDGSQTPYKFAVNSTIIQNSVAGASSGEKRGMFSSVGAYWNQDTDGMWSYKHDAGEKLGLEIVASIIWISI